MQLDAEMNLSNVNSRVEMAGDELGPLAMDLTLTADLREDMVAGLFTTEAAYKQLLGWRWNSDHELAFPDNLKVPLEREALGVTFELWAPLGTAKKPELRFTEAKVDKITFEIKPGRVVGVKFRVQTRASSDEIGQANSWLKQSPRFTLWSRTAEARAEESEDQSRLFQQGPDHPAEGGSSAEVQAASAEAKGDQIPLEDSQRAPAEKPLFTPVDHPDAVVPGQRPPQRPKRHGAAAAH